MDRLGIVALVNAAIDRLNNRPLGLGGLRKIGTGATDAAPGNTVVAIVAADVLVKTATTAFSAERVVTDSATVTWDWSTPGQATATAGGLSQAQVLTRISFGC